MSPPEMSQLQTKCRFIISVRSAERSHIDFIWQRKMVTSKSTGRLTLGRSSATMVLSAFRTLSVNKKTKQMTEVKLVKPEKGSDIYMIIKDTYKSVMNQMLMNEDMFKREGTPDNNHLIECSISRKLQLFSCIVASPRSSTDASSQQEPKHHTWKCHQTSINMVSRQDQ